MKRLYHSGLFLAALVLLAFGIVGCKSDVNESDSIPIAILVDNQRITLEATPGETVRDALTLAGIELGGMDRVEPPEFSLLSAGMEISVIRVKEEFEIEQVVIPYEQQIQPSEYLAEGEQQTLQMGENGLQEVTYRRVFENGVEVSRSPIKQTVLKEPIPQIILVGVKSSNQPVEIPGRIVFASGGNAWMIEQTTANRIPILTSGDLDGRIFELSDDGSWLLFTRKAEDEGKINELWAISLDEPDKEIYLQVDNVIHYAEWEPNSTNSVYYSTVEPRDAPPGWQANNDLYNRLFSTTGWIARWQEIIGANSGGIYGWWGTDFVLNRAGDWIAYASPDELGRIDLVNGDRYPLLEIIPYLTRGDWAWVPGIQWSPDGKFIYAVDHESDNSSANNESSPHFNLVAISIENGYKLNLVDDVGMFSYPKLSPEFSREGNNRGFKVAYLQATNPAQSETSRYNVMIMDSDGSNRKQIFPKEGSLGIEPRKNWGAWSPEILTGSESYGLLVLYQGDLWLIHPMSGDTQQITGDGQITNLDWK